MGITIFSYSDEDGDNFYEKIRIFNYDDKSGDFKLACINIEDFYIDKSSGEITYSQKTCKTTPKIIWNRIYSEKSPIEAIVKEIPDKYKIYFAENRYASLNKEGIYSLFPGYWTFYGGFGERVRKLINAGKDSVELNNMIGNERYLQKNRRK